MLTKNEILVLVGMVAVTDQTKNYVEMILRNYGGEDLVSSEKLEVICQLIIKK